MASDLAQPTPIFEQFVKQILALVAIPITAATVSARRSSFAFAMAGLGLFDQKNAARRDHAHRNRLQNLC